MSVGLSLDAAIIGSNLLLIIGGAVALMVLKIVLVFALLRFGKLGFSESVRGAVLLSPVGEFAFVILPLAASVGLLAGTAATILSAMAALTMFFGPILAKVAEPALAWRKKRLASEPTMEENYDGADGEVLVIGFGRFGQVVNQMFLAARAQRDRDRSQHRPDQDRLAIRLQGLLWRWSPARCPACRRCGECQRDRDLRR